MVGFITGRVIPIRIPQEGEGNDQVDPALSPFLKISISGSLRGERKRAQVPQREGAQVGESLVTSSRSFCLAGDEG